LIPSERQEAKNNELTIPPNLLSKEFHVDWGVEEQPDLREFKDH
jgi:hypothetical protein